MQIDVFEDFLYVSLHQKNFIVRIYKFGLENNITTLEVGLTRISDLAIYQMNKQYVFCKFHRISILIM